MTTSPSTNSSSVQSVSFYEFIQTIGTKIKNNVIKTLNYVLPRNPVTQCREFRFIPTAIENTLGAIYYNDVCPRYKISRNAQITHEVQKVFDKLVQQSVRNKELSFEVRVMEDDKTVNAFCLPGGKIVITTAMLNKLRENTPINSSVVGENDKMTATTFEDRLASVLGHEIAHAAAGHGRRGLQFKLTSFLAIKAVSFTLGIFLKHKEDEALAKEKADRVAKGKPPMQIHEEYLFREKYQTRAHLLQAFFEGISKVGRFFSVLSHGRCHELEADKYGMKISAKAGFNPMASVWLQHKFLEMKGQKDKEEEQKSFFMRLFTKSIDLFSTHPPSLCRLQANRIIVEDIEKKGHQAIYPEL